jgi:nucleobase:cation symporter-1, NCS1 family
MGSSGIIESRSIDYVPLAERRGRVWHLWPVWFSGDAHLATLAVGVLGIALGGNLLWSAVAVTSGCAFGTFFMAFHSTQGPQLGLPQMIQSRPQFGYIGALLVWAVALIAYIGFNAFNQVLAAQTIHELSGSIPANSRTVMVGFGALATLLAICGYHVIHVSQRVFAYLMISALIVFTIAAVFLLHVPAGQWDLRGFKTQPFLAAFFAAATYQLSWSIYVSDYSRYLPRDVGVLPSFWWTYLGAFIGGTWMMLVGTIAAAVAPKLDIAAGLRQTGDAMIPGLGLTVLVVSLLGVVAITTLNFYGSSLTLLSVADTCKPIRSSAFKRIVSLVAALAISSFLAFNASGNFVTQFANLLSILLYLFTPWTAINLVDFYLVRKGRYSIREIFNPKGMYGRWNWRGLTAYFVGFASMIPFFRTDWYTGPLARLIGVDIAMLIGLPVSAVCYLIFCRSLDMERDRSLALAADRGLEPGSGHGGHSDAWDGTMMHRAEATASRRFSI